MISWHNAPTYSYKGFIYKPDVMEYDDGVRKAMHDIVSRLEPNRVVYSTNVSPYRWMTEDEFKAFIDQMERITAS